MADIVTLKNPGHLKLDLIIRGLKISREALSSARISRYFELSNMTGAALELNLVLPGDVLVNIPILECLAEEKPYTLIKKGDRFFIEHYGDSVEVWVAPTPEYYDRQTSSGAAMVKIGRTYGGYLAISPTPACQFLDEGLGCRYCDHDVESRAWSVDEVLEMVEAALGEGAAEYICLNVGYKAAPDGGIAMLEPYIEAIKDRFDVLVCVQAQPPAEDHWIDAGYAMGIDSIAYNIEVYDPDMFELIAPGKQRMVGRDRYFEALRHAAKIFPSGAVVSNLIIGAEPIESTVKGIDVLTASGIIPTLPIYRKGLSESLDADSAVEALPPVFKHLHKALKRNKLTPTLISHFNLAFNAVEGQFFSGEAPLRGRWESLLKSKRGAKLAVNLSRVRRRLRVRPVEDGVEEKS